MKVAWIGLGAMGLPTAKNIAAGGHTVRAFDIKPPAAADAPDLILSASAREAAQDCDMLCIAVFSDVQVQDVLHGPDGVMAGLKAGAIVAIFTTGAIETAQALAASAPTGIAVLDTCFSRKPSDMESWLLTLLVGGEAEAIDRARPVFDTFAPRIFHVGPSGAGRKIKLVNNILYAGHLLLAADALRFAKGLGLDPVATAAALGECSGSSGVLSRMTEEDPAEMVSMGRRYMVKDVAAAATAAEAAGVDLAALGTVTAAFLES